MAPSSKKGKNMADVHLRDSASRNDIDPVLHPEECENHIDIFHIPELVYHHCKITHVILCSGFCNDNFNAVDIIYGGVADQIIEHKDLIRG